LIRGPAKGVPEQQQRLARPCGQSYKGQRVQHSAGTLEVGALEWTGYIRQIVRHGAVERNALTKHACDRVADRGEGRLVIAIGSRIVLLVQHRQRACARWGQKCGAGWSLMKKLRHLIVEKRPAHKPIAGQRSASSCRQFDPGMEGTDMLWIEVWLNRGFICCVHLTRRLQHKQFLIGLDVDRQWRGALLVERRWAIRRYHASLHLQPAFVGTNDLGDIAEHLEPAIRQPADSVTGSAQRGAIVRDHQDSRSGPAQIDNALL
jgi:hypothetical protein